MFVLLSEQIRYECPRGRYTRNGRRNVLISVELPQKAITGLVCSMSNVTTNRIVSILGTQALSHQPIDSLNSPFWQVATPGAYKEITP
jgi:hypothetical protein